MSWQNKYITCTYENRLGPEMYLPPCLCELLQQQLEFFMVLLEWSGRSNGSDGSFEQVIRGRMRALYRELSHPHGKFGLLQSDVFVEALYVYGPSTHIATSEFSWPFAAGYSLSEVFVYDRIRIHELLYVLDAVSEQTKSDKSAVSICVWQYIVGAGAWMSVIHKGPCPLHIYHDDDNNVPRIISSDPMYRFSKYRVDRSAGSLEALLRSLFQAFLVCDSNQSFHVADLCDLVLDYFSVCSLQVFDLLFLPLVLQSEFCLRDTQFV